VPNEREESWRGSAAGNLRKQMEAKDEKTQAWKIHPKTTQLGEEREKGSRQPTRKAKDGRRLCL